MLYDEVLEIVSEPRLTYYKEFLNCQSDQERLGAYLAFQELSGSFFPLIQTVEVSLRNAIHKASIEHFADSEWYTKIPQSQESKNIISRAIEKAENECINPSSDDVIARTTLGFWVYMMDSPYRNTQNGSFLWTPDIKAKVFPHAKNPWGADLTVAAIFDECQKLLKLRNRLFHHEPIWKKHNCNSLQKAVNNVEKDYKFLLKILGFMSKAKHDLVFSIGSPSKFYERCTLDTIHEIINHIKPEEEAE